MQVGKEFLDTAFQKEVSLLNRKNRDNKLGTASTAGWPDRPGSGQFSTGTNFYSFKTEKIPAGKLVLGDWLGRYRVTTRVGFFFFCLTWGQKACWWWSGGLLAMVTKGLQSSSEVTWVLGYASMALVQGLAPVALGQDSTVHVTIPALIPSLTIRLHATKMVCFTWLPHSRSKLTCQKQVWKKHSLLLKGKCEERDELGGWD